MKTKGKRNALAKMLLQYRTDNNLTCEKIAKMLGMEKQQYSRYELNIDAFPTLYNIKKLANVMNIKEEEMYKILIEDNKAAIQRRFGTLLRSINISDDDLLTIVMMLLQYYYN